MKLVNVEEVSLKRIVVSCGMRDSRERVRGEAYILP